MTRSWWTSISTSYLHVTTHTLVGFWSVATACADHCRPMATRSTGKVFWCTCMSMVFGPTSMQSSRLERHGNLSSNQLQTANAHLRLGITWYNWYNPIFYTNLDHAKTEFMVLSDLILFLDFVLPCLSLHCAIDTLCKLENCKPFVVMCIANDWLLQNLRHAPKSTVMLVGGEATLNWTSNDDFGVTSGRWLNPHDSMISRKVLGSTGWSWCLPVMLGSCCAQWWWRCCRLAKSVAVARSSPLTWSIGPSRDTIIFEMIYPMDLYTLSIT